MKKEKILRNIFVVLMIFLFVLIVSTPLLVGKGVTFVDEEVLEAAVIFALLIIGITIFRLYQRELAHHEKELADTLSYIGAINLQVEQIRSIGDILTRYPESKEDFKYLFDSLAQKALGGVPSDWVLFRIIDISSGKTLTEFTKGRGKAAKLRCEIGNAELLENRDPEGCRMVASSQENLDIRVYCVVPVAKLSENEHVLLKAIVNNLGMLYIIFNSGAVKKNNHKNNGK